MPDLLPCVLHHLESKVKSNEVRVKHPLGITKKVRYPVKLEAMVSLGLWALIGSFDIMALLLDDK